MTDQLTVDTFIVRLASTADYQAVVNCVEAAFIKWVAIMGMKPVALTADYHDFINRGVVYVLEGSMPNDLAGVLIIWPVDDALYVDTIAINPAYQKQGLGARLLDFAEDKALKANLHKLTLVTNAKMISNQNYYQKRGFVETRRDLLEPGRVGVWMMKPLAAE